MIRLPVFLLIVLQLFISRPSDAQVATEKASVTSMNGVPVYTSFDAFEHWLHLDNDTTYVINFWATWCKPCVEELPYFEQLHEQFKDQKVKVVLVSLDFKRDIERKLLPFIATKQLKSAVVVLADSRYNDWIEKVSTQWDGAIPVTLMYKGGKREFKAEEFANYKELKTMMEQVRG